MCYSFFINLSYSADTSIATSFGPDGYQDSDFRTFGLPDFPTFRPSRLPNFRTFGLPDFPTNTPSKALLGRNTIQFPNVCIVQFKRNRFHIFFQMFNA